MYRQHLKTIIGFMAVLALSPQVVSAADYSATWEYYGQAGGSVADIVISPDGKYQAVISAGRTGSIPTYSALCSNPGSRTSTTFGAGTFSSDFGKTKQNVSYGDFAPSGAAFSADFKHQALIGREYSVKYSWKFQRSAGALCGGGGGDGYVRAADVVLKDIQYVKVSSDSGATWRTITLPANSSAVDVAMSQDGKYQTYILGTNFYTTGGLYSSSDYGVTWTKRSLGANWNNIIISKTGKYQTATMSSSGTLLGGLYVSADYGATWTLKVSSDLFYVPPKGVAMNDTGQYQFYVDSVNKNLYMSSDYGATWSVKSSFASLCTTSCYGALAVSDDHKYIGLLSGPANPLYISSDSGATWSSRSSVGGGVTARIAFSGDGKYELAGTVGSSSSSNLYRNVLTGKITLSSNKSTSWTITGPSGASVTQSLDGVTTTSPQAGTITGSGHPQNHLYKSLPLGEYTIVWETIDGYQPSIQTLSLVEADETRNFEVIYASPDLSTFGLSLSGDLVQDSPIGLSAQITNAGASDVSINFPNIFQIDYDDDHETSVDQKIDASPIEVVLDVNTSTETRAMWTPSTTGTYYVNACADRTKASSSGVVPESNNDNNCGGWKKIIVLDKPYDCPSCESTPGTFYSIDQKKCVPIRCPSGTRWSELVSPPACVAK